MSIKLKPYDVKLLVKALEVEVGRPIAAHTASNVVSIVLKWVEKSVILSKSKVDDVVLALYPSLIKFISTKIDLKEYNGDFDMEKAWDIPVLLKQLEISGLVLAEQAVVSAIEICLAWIKQSAADSENAYDDLVTVIIPVILAPLDKAVNSISKDIESRIDIPESKNSVLKSLKNLVN